jgi:hypothetical protein
MAGKNTAVFGIVPSRADAERAVDAIIAAGFSKDDVSVLAPDQQTTHQLATEKNTKAPEGTATGAATGGAIGGTLGLLAGIGAFAIPGIGPLIAAGPLVGALAGVGAGAATGGLVGALVGMGIPEYEAKRYEGRVKDGGVLISIHCDSSDEVGRAKNILEGMRAADISSAGEKSVSSHGVQTRTGEYDTDFRRDYEKRYAASGHRYDEFAPAYDYGYRMGRDPRYKGRAWSDVENDMRRDYATNFPQSTWEKFKDAVRYGWERVTLPQSSRHGPTEI